MLIYFKNFVINCSHFSYVSLKTHLVKVEDQGALNPRLLHSLWVLVDSLFVQPLRRILTPSWLGRLESLTTE